MNSHRLLKSYNTAVVFLESVTWFQNKFFILELGQELLEPSVEIWELILSRDPADQVGLLEAG